MGVPMPITPPLTHAQTAPCSGADACARPRRSERGFSLIELIVVGLIIAILLGVIISTFRGSKKATYAKAGQVSAYAYQDAVEAYMADNGQRAPHIGDKTQWHVDADRGPIDPQFSNKTYMRTIPEQVRAGMVDLVVKGEKNNPSAQAIIEYTAEDGAPGLYSFHVWVAQGDDGVRHLQCVLTNRAQLQPGEKRCVS